VPVEVEKKLGQVAPKAAEAVEKLAQVASTRRNQPKVAEANLVRSLRIHP